MKRLYILFYFWVSLSVTAAAIPGQLSIQTFQIDNGLSHNNVWCTLQDSYGFMWIGTNEGLNRFDGKHYKIVAYAANNEHALGNNSILSLYEDNEKNLWVGTEYGIYIYDLIGEKFHRFNVQTEDGVIISTEVSKMLEDEQGRVWIGTLGQGFFIYDSQSGTLTQNTRHSSHIWALHKNPAGNIFLNSDNGDVVEFNKSGYYANTYQSPELSNSLRDVKVTSIYYKDGILWYGLDVFGLVRLDLQTREMRMLRPGNNQSTSYIRSIHPYSDRELLIGAGNGLYLLDVQNEQYEPVDNQGGIRPGNDWSVNHIYTDREGGLWLSTRHGGVNYLAQTSALFEHYYPFDRSGMRIGKVIRGFYEDGKGNVWITLEDGGVAVYYPQTNTFSAFQTSSNYINTLFMEQDKVWLGTESRGIDVYDLKDGSLKKNYQFRNGDPRTLSDNSVQSIYQTSYGDIFIGTAWGINRYNRDTDDFSPIPQIAQVGNLASVSDIKEDSRGFVWFTTANAGIFRYNPADDRWSGFSNNRHDANSVPVNKITTVFEDSRGQIWFGTEGRGICRYDYDKNAFATFDPEAKILPSQIIYRIEEDENGNFWLSSNSGLICVNPETKEILGHFTREDGLQSNQFNFQSSLRAGDGKMYFGGINGFNTFYPRNIVYNVLKSNIQITNLYLYGEEVTAITENSPLKESIFETQELTLKHNQNSISFDFADLSYKSLSKKQYVYTMEGLENRWINAGSSRSVFFNNLAPGHYTFRVKALEGNTAAEPSEASIKIHILPPFYKTGIAYLVYVLLLMLFVYAFLVWWSKRLRKKNEVLMYEEQTKREKELYVSKIDFFTNLVHEIRTPLSLIKIPLDYIIKSQDGNNDTKSYLKTIEKNTNRLLNLVNQLLDFRKVEESNFELAVRPIDIITLVEEVCSRFIPIARIRNIEFAIHPCAEKFQAGIDPEAVTKIISNLLTNALKYTHDRIEVSVVNHESYFEIMVSDNGEGISEGEEEKIFETFYQSDKSKSGTGIGLPLARLLAGKHGGKLFVQRTAIQGATFVLSVPLAQGDAVSTPEVRDVITTQLLPVDTESNRANAVPDTETDHPEIKPNLLLVEDNEELLEVTASFLQEQYNTYIALNGMDALKVLEEENISIIVSDLMMPEMDGYELCEFVKNDNRFCHIPVVILTAKTSLNARIKGLETGADAYIEKPYSLEHLLVQISNLLENRRKLIELYFTSSYLPGTGELGLQKKDREFIDRLNDEIEKHIQDTDFSIDSLAQEMNMSRSNFYRKVKGLFDMSPNDYLRTFRLRKSVELLQKGEYRIGEIYLLVGFNSPSYFAKCFKKQYGVTPKEYLMKKDG